MRLNKYNLLAAISCGVLAATVPSFPANAQSFAYVVNPRRMPQVAP
jgi:hypothetical protein